MPKNYPEYSKLEVTELEKAIGTFWDKNAIFEKSVTNRKDAPHFTFYEGPPSANGLPGIHHVISRAIKDVFCRFQTLMGKKVERKAGWDTHGLPVELQVEKELNISKEDIGKKISIADYNAACKKAVMKYTDVWEQLTRLMGYWVNMDDPYITYNNKYMETVWWLLEQFHKKGLLYKGFTVQPYSPAAGSALSTHELNQPGCYRELTDTTIVAEFLIENEQTEKSGTNLSGCYFLAWTTTPWTLPANTALAVGEKIIYCLVNTFNKYTGNAQKVILGKDLLPKYFDSKNEKQPEESLTFNAKNIEYVVLQVFTGKDLLGLRYKQLFDYAKPDGGDAFKVIIGDYVSTEEGTGIVHIAPSHGADDFRVAKQQNIGSILLVDKQGKFTKEMGEFAGEYVKEDYYAKNQLPDNYKNVDVRLAIALKERNQAFLVEKYRHSYPHCWRTDKPIIYAPMDSWFIKTTAIKDKLLALNNTINWKPASTGTGRFGNWIENLVDWNLSRSRYWGVPLPIWRTKDGSEEKCIGSVAELAEEINIAIKRGFMKSNPYLSKKIEFIDLHRPFIDDVVLSSAKGEKMYRETDIIDVWFESGSMPYAQEHYPFENNNKINERTHFPADFIAEGVDQTRGWFFTLHVIAAAIFDSVAYKNVVANGLVLDKYGAKMSKSKGNTVDPFITIKKHGADALRWYMLSNSNPWENLKFNEKGIEETRRKFFGTLFNTYSFFALYANVDNFNYSAEPIIPIKNRQEIDQWICSELHSLIKKTEKDYNNYEITPVVRAIQEFTEEKLSNWYVRRSRRRFWKGAWSSDKKAAYQTLFECLNALAIIASPVAPFFTDWLYRNLHQNNAKKTDNLSVHLANWPNYDAVIINKKLEAIMQLAQNCTSLALSIRKKENIRVRQPLSKMLIPAANETIQEQLLLASKLIKEEVNVKSIEILRDVSDIIVKSIKPNFKVLGPRFGKSMKAVSDAIDNFDSNQINMLEEKGAIDIKIDSKTESIKLEEIEITFSDIPGWKIAAEGNTTVALDITLNNKLIEEGIARDVVNRLQNVRKSRQLQITDRINVQIDTSELVQSAIMNNLDYICSEILADNLALADLGVQNTKQNIELENNETMAVLLQKSEVNIPEKKS